MTTPSDPQQAAPPAIIEAGGVFLPASVCHPLWLALRTQLARSRAEGGAVRPEIVSAMNALRSASLAHHAGMSATNGQPERTFADIDAPSDRELIRTEQLAVRLGVTQRHARRLAAWAGVTPAKRNAWHPDDVAHLVRIRRTANDPAAHAPAGSGP
ncbi:hypothetical protein PV350_13930 [Streptomyces sp. PA03-6a]|nr:hypothetical protein [Streptomyces sp. PA03-6a]